MASGHLGGVIRRADTGREMRNPFMLRSTHERVVAQITGDARLTAVRLSDGLSGWQRRAMQLGKALSHANQRNKFAVRFAHGVRDKHERLRRLKKLVQA